MFYINLQLEVGYVNLIKLLSFLLHYSEIISDFDLVP